MKKKGITKVFFYLLISLILITFLMTYSTIGCGRRALLREKLKSVTESEASQSASVQSDSKNETVEEDVDSEEKQIITEGSAEQDSISDEGTTQESVSNNEEETTADEETTEETSPEGEESIEQEEQEPVNTTINAVQSECGCLLGEIVSTTSMLFVGDNSTTNEESRIFLSYDISELSGSIISGASISATAEFKNGNPFETYGPIIVKAIYWGKNPIPFSGNELDGVELANFTRKDFKVENAILNEDLQKAVNSGSERYQITIYFEMNGTDGDNIDDNIMYNLNQIIFNVTFIPPEGD